MCRVSRSLVGDEFRDDRLNDGNHESGGGCVGDPHGEEGCDTHEAQHDTAMDLLQSRFLYEWMG